MLSKIFVSSVASALKVSKPSNSISAWSVHKTSQYSFWHRIPPPVYSICPKFFNFLILESPNFATKDIFFLSMKLILIQLHAGRSFYDEWLTSLARFCFFSRFCQIFTRPGKNFVGVFLWFVRSGQNLSSRDKQPHLQNFGDDRKLFR